MRLVESAFGTSRSHQRPSTRMIGHGAARHRHLQHRQGLGPRHDLQEARGPRVRGRRAADPHAHKVEVSLTKAQREEVRKRFEDSAVELAGLGSAFEYQSTDPAVVRENIEGTKAYVRLAHDIGSPGVKVRPNGMPKGADLEATLRQIGRALHEVGEDAEDFGIEIRVEVHGGVTQSSTTSPGSSSTPTTPTSSPAGTPTRPTSRTAPSRTTSPWSPPGSARSTSAT